MGTTSLSKADLSANKPMSLGEFFEEFGHRNVALELGLSKSICNHWLNKRKTPTVYNMQRLIKLSGFRLTYESIIDSTQPYCKRGDI